MKYLLLIGSFVCLLSSYGQTNTQKWETALSAVKHHNEQVVKTTIEFNDVALTKIQWEEIKANLNSKNEIVDYTLIEGKTLVIYHMKSIDDSGLKVFIVPVATNFNLVKTEIMTLEDIDRIYTDLH